MYPPELVAPRRLNSLTRDLKLLQTMVALDLPGTTLVAINSVCGCSASSMRHMIQSIEHDKAPDNITTIRWC